METKKILHILRNPYGWSEEEQKKARLAAACEIEALRDAYRNMRDFAGRSGLDTAVSNRNHAPVYKCGCCC